MCIAIYSPGRHLIVEYLSESIRLKKDGGAVIFYDLLINNPGPNNITSFFLVFPFPMDGEEESVKDITGSLLNDDNYYNTFYELIPKGLLKSSDPDSRHIISELEIDLSKYDESKDNVVVLNIPTPTRTEREEQGGPNIKLVGIVPKHYDCDEEKRLTLTQNSAEERNFWNHYCRFSFIEFKMNNGIKPDSSRWLRLLIKPGKKESTIMSKKEMFVRAFFGRLRFDYAFFGPQDVMSQLRERTRAAIKSLQTTEEKLKKTFTDIDNMLFHDGFCCPETKTTVKDFRINVFPLDAGRPQLLNWTGPLSVLGNLPNIYHTDSTNTLLYSYQWRARNFELSNQDLDESKFRIFFTVYPLLTTIIISKIFIYICAILAFINFFQLCF